MTVEQVQQRKEQYQRELAQAQANVHAYQGAIQDCDYWLEVLADKKGLCKLCGCTEKAEIHFPTDAGQWKSGRHQFDPATPASGEQA